MTRSEPAKIVDRETRVPVPALPPDPLAGGKRLLPHPQEQFCGLWSRTILAKFCVFSLPMFTHRSIMDT